MRLTERSLRNIIRQSLLKEITKGGTHTFHGNKWPAELVGLPGPRFDDGVAVTDNDLKYAEDWLEEYEPEKLVAYSRGSAVLNKFAAKHPNAELPEITYIAPAAKRDQWGTKDIPSPKIKGRAIASSGDGAVPVKQVCQVAKEAGIPMYVVPGKFEKEDWRKEGISNHIRVLKHKDSSSPGKQMNVDACLASELPNWGTGVADKETLQKQITLSDELLEAVIRRILLEKIKKEVKCPLLPNGKRDYKCEYQKYGGADKKNKLERAARNRARKQAEKMGIVRKGDGMELDHIKPLCHGGSNDQTNWQVMSRTDNRKKGKKWDGKLGN